jgi:hypothetical protein
MKKQVLSMLMLAAATTTTHAQTVVTDSVMLGAGYANQVWYSLANDEQGSAAKNNWDLAFDVVDVTSSIHINSASGVMLWNYPKSDKTAWASVDTNGLSTWNARYNTDTSWAVGAMGAYADPSNWLDMDWGTYDMSTHQITGDSIYIIKLVSGDYKKLYIEKLTGGTFYFKFANLDGSSEKSEQVSKSQFTDKNLGYYSIVNEAAVNREPNADTWDLVFTQYTGFIPIPYTLTGVLHNRGVSVAKAANIPNKTSYTGWQAHSFMSEINTIGYDWKSHIGMGVYSVQDSLVFFVGINKQAGADIWKLIFTGFEAADGKFFFDKQKLVAASINDVEGNTTTMALYPNPASGSNVQVVYNLQANNKTAMLQVTDIAGRIVYAQSLDSTAGTHTAMLTNSFSSGLYIVSVTTDAGLVQQKLVVN